MNTKDNRIKELRLKSGLSQEKLGKLVGVSKQAIYNYETARANPSLFVCQKIADVFSVSLEYLLRKTDKRENSNLEGVYKAGYENGLIESKMIPVYSNLSCGTGSFVDEIPEDTIRLPEAMVRSAVGLFANRAEGDSMEPGINNGDYLIFEQCDDIPSGKVGSFSLNGEYYCKRLEKMPNGGVFLFSDNRKYQPIHIQPDDNFRPLGLLKAKISKW